MKLCTPCRETREPFIRPLHVVHPTTWKPQVFDAYGLAMCPTCNAVWRATRRNTFELVTT